MGEGHTYWERIRQWVLCPKCNMELVAGSLDSHRNSQNGVTRGNLRDTPPTPRMIPGHIGYPSCGHHATFLSQWRYVRGGPWSGVHSGYTSCTATCMAQYWSCRRVTTPSRAVPSVTCFSHGRG